MLTKLEVVNSRGSVLDLPLSDENNAFFVQMVEGLDPVAASLVSSSFANLDGAQYNSSRREPRNIKLQLGFNPDYVLSSVRTLRRQLYDFFMPKTEVKMRFHWFDEFDTNIITQNKLVEIMARIESTPTPLFVKDPVADISFVCFDPDFIVPEPVVVNGNTVADATEILVSYDGSVETGILLTLNVNRALPSFTVYHRPPDDTLRMIDFTEPLEDLDTLKISTVVGSKYATRTRLGVDSPLLYGITPQSNWLELQPGDNYFRVYAPGAAVPYSLQYITRHGGL